MNPFKYIKSTLCALILALITTSCNVSEIEDQIHVGEIESLQIKGLTTIEMVVRIENESKYELSMREGVAEIYVDGDHIMQLKQVGVTVSEPKSNSSVKTLWKIGGIDPLSLLSYSGRLLSQDFTGMTMDYKAKIAANKLSKTIKGEGVVLKEFITTFAK